ncbi:unnamed protein product [Linum trigynum]|uniref:Uncharacterized protein n=1 Tax=Linum trigynum TaxID=586398 RepID=A0AAV2FVI2_9ROSI
MTISTRRTTNRQREEKNTGCDDDVLGSDRKAREKMKDEVDLLVLGFGWKRRTTNNVAFSFSSSAGKYKRRQPSLL